MGYLERHAAQKYRPENLLPGCRSILFAALNYYQRPAEMSPEPPSGRIARYAWGRDYHRIFGKRLRRIVRELRSTFPDEDFRHGSDATPLAERSYAEEAGVGYVGRNTLLISGQYGSWFLLGEILSTRYFPQTGPPEGKHGACPRGCNRCIDVCPTKALEAPYRINASRCISYLTIELKGSIPEELRPLMGDWLFGCDLCQEVCPLNVRSQVTRDPDFTSRRAGSSADLASILDIADEDEFRKRFAGTPLMRAKREGLLRNACVVAGNTRAESLLPRLRRLRKESSAILREHAEWAIQTIVAGQSRRE
jgi:epoxyqueuosine reductase